MARTKKRGKRDGSKSEAIRAYVQNNPSAKHADVVRALKADGISVSYNLVANIRSKAGKTPANGRSTHAARGVSNGRSAETPELGSGFTAAIEFIRTAGGIDNAKQIIEQISIIKSL